jgi:predicted glycosyltransferase involved in capsule biosynthesis
LSKHTYIIGYKHSADQLVNLLKTLDWLSRLDNLDVFVVEVGQHSNISNINLKARHIFIKSNEKLYNRSWCFNIGLKYCTTENVIFGDCDVIMEYQSFISSLNLLENYDVVAPYNKIINLNKSESMQLNTDIFNKKALLDDHNRLSLSGGICFFKTDSIRKIGGWCESFEGQGYEDIGLDVLIKSKMTWVASENVAYHLYHQSVLIDADQHSNNANLSTKMINMSSTEIDRIIINSCKDNGKLNKYV